VGCNTLQTLHSDFFRHPFPPRQLDADAGTPRYWNCT